MEHTQYYLGYRVSLSDVHPWKDILICHLGEVGFDMFEDLENGFVAWGLEEIVDQNGANAILADYEKNVSLLYTIERTPVQNWNEEWEKNFEPVEIPGFLRIQAPFHPPKDGFEFTITIAPKMAFGTGHHATTLGMCMLMRKIHFREKRVLDMGCGTGVLGILALKMGAYSVAGIDIDEWAVTNTRENAGLNAVDMPVIQGDANAIDGMFDVILANIQRNVLLADIPVYAKHLAHKGSLLVSGFYEKDVADIVSLCAAHHLNISERFVHSGWVALHFQKLN